MSTFFNSYKREAGPRETTTLFYDQPREGLNTFRDAFPHIKRSIQRHLRKQLEIPYDVEYLIGLKGFVERYGERSKAIDVFTLNYDSVIETFCEKEGIPYTDTRARVENRLP